MTDFFKLSSIFRFVLIAECCGDDTIFQWKCILNCRLHAVIVDGLDTDTYCISVVAGVHYDVHDAHVNTCRTGSHAEILNVTSTAGLPLVRQFASFLVFLRPK